jgi:hypothetical protein
MAPSTTECSTMQFTIAIDDSWGYCEAFNPLARQIRETLKFPRRVIIAHHETLRPVDVKPEERVSSHRLSRLGRLSLTGAGLVVLREEPRRQDDPRLCLMGCRHGGDGRCHAGDCRAYSHGATIGENVEKLLIL